MRLHVVARVYGGENRKGRPGYYSKRTSLASILQACERSGAEVTLLADGPIPSELRDMVSILGRIVDLQGGPIGMRRSYVAAIDYATKSSWSDADLVYFCEDDYLHQPDSLIRLREAAESIRDASYFALYASTPDHPATPWSSKHIVPEDWVSSSDAFVGDVRWVHVPSTASTFGARVGALRADRGIFRQALVPYRKRYLDHEMFLVVQGRLPYTPRELVLGPEETRFRTGVRLFAANAFLAPFRIAYQARSLTRRRTPHLLYAADPNLASHMETDLLAAGTDWSKVAAIAQAWADDRLEQAIVIRASARPRANFAGGPMEVAVTTVRCSRRNERGKPRP